MSLAGIPCLALLVMTSTARRADEGGTWVASHCAMNHRSDNTSRAPLPAALAQMSRDASVPALENGSMKAHGQGLTHEERLTIAAFLSKASAAGPSSAGMRGSDARPFNLDGSWQGRGVDLATTRFRPDPGLRREDVPRLKLKWAFGLPNATPAYGQPLVDSGRVNVGSPDGAVYSVDAGSGCTY